MISRLTGKITAVFEERVVLSIGFMDIDVLISEYTRRQLQLRTGEEISLFTIFYIDGNPAQGRLTPKLLGFQTETERNFFELFCKVDGVGSKKALGAMIWPVSDIAVAIEQQDAKTLAKLPGIGPATAERIIAKLRRTVPKFAMGSKDSLRNSGIPADVLSEAFQALVVLGHSEANARQKLEKVSESGKTFSSVQEVLEAVYRN